jgi:putative OPT family oligopeptide transporter
MNHAKKIAMQTDAPPTLPEITLKAVLLGIALAIVLAAANAYLGLFAGMTVSASIPAAVVSMGILRMFRTSNILENNIVQTAASAGESLAAGVIFTLPGLLILGYWETFDFAWVAAIAGFGGLLGVLLTIPLRRSLIVEGDLKFPEGIATAEVLETGQEGGAGLRHIARAALAGGLYKTGGFLCWKETMQGAAFVGGVPAYFGSYLSPALLAVGYIVGLNIAVLIFIGGAGNWLVAIPLCSLLDPPAGAEAMDALALAGALHGEKTKYIGVGAMLVGGLWAIFQMRTSLVSGIRSGLEAYGRSGEASAELPRTERDLPMKWILVLILASIVPLFLIYRSVVGDAVAVPMSIIMLAAGFLFSAVAGYMAGLVGSSNNPVSGITIATIVLSSLLLVLLMGRDDPGTGAAAAIIMGSVVCCAAAIAGDNMQDLKAGRIVGATPWKQQIMQLIGTVSAALILAPVLVLLQKAYGFQGMAGAGEKAFEAPQANLMASVAKGVFEGGLPWGYMITGMVVAALVIAADAVLERTGSRFRMPVLAVAIGFYLPLRLATPILAGGLVAMLAGRYHARRTSGKEAAEEAGRNALLFSSGLITGEALTGILLAIPMVILKEMQTGREPPLLPFEGSEFLAAAVLAGIVAWLYRTATGPREAR